jgi:hypothetical protein
VSDAFVGRLIVRFVGVASTSISIDATVVSCTVNSMRVVVCREEFANTGSHPTRVPPQPSGPQALVFGVQQLPFARQT